MVNGSDVAFAYSWIVVNRLANKVSGSSESRVDQPIELRPQVKEDSVGSFPSVHLTEANEGNEEDGKGTWPLPEVPSIALRGLPRISA